MQKKMRDYFGTIFKKRTRQTTLDEFTKEEE